MGLDTVELVIEVESAFGIQIPDAEASGLITVGQLYEYVLSKLPTVETRRCASAAAFYRFRRAVVGQLSVGRGDVRPSVPIGGVIPPTRRRSEWALLGESLGWRMPPLVRPGWMVTAFYGLIVGWLMVVVRAWGRFPWFPVNQFPLVVAYFVVGVMGLLAVAYRLTTPFATRFPRECSTVRGTVQAALALNYGTISLQGPGWNRREVWECLRAIIVEQLGVAPEEVVESAEFVKDFGAD